jgi:hypothetical protein
MKTTVDLVVPEQQISCRATSEGIKLHLCKRFLERPDPWPILANVLCSTYSCVSDLPAQRDTQRHKYTGKTQTPPHTAKVSSRVVTDSRGSSGCGAYRVTCTMSCQRRSRCRCCSYKSRYMAACTL